MLEVDEKKWKALLIKTYPEIRTMFMWEGVSYILMQQHNTLKLQATRIEELEQAMQRISLNRNFHNA